MSRLKALDSLRGIAALTVVTYHCWMAIPNHPSGGVAHWLTHHAPLSLLLNARPAVILFFVLSGFVLTGMMPPQGEKLSYLKFAARRLCRIYLPFLVAIGLSAAIFLALAAAGATGAPDQIAVAPWFANVDWPLDITLKTVLKHILMTGRADDMRLDAVMWSLVYEVRISLIFPILFFVVRRAPFLGLAVSISISFEAALAYGCSDFFCKPLSADTWIGAASATAYFTSFFVVGVVLALKTAAIRQWLTRTPAWAILAAVFCAGYVAALDRDIASGVAAAAIIALAIAAPSVQRAVSLFPFLWLGRVSYSLYLVHLLVLGALTHLLWQCADMWLIGALAIAGSLVASEAMYRLVEEPAIELGRIIGGLRPTSARRLMPAQSPTR